MNTSQVQFERGVINDAIAKIVKAGKAQTRAIETVLVMAVYDSIVHQSPETANALIGALRMSTRKDGIIAFLEKFGQLFNKGGKTGFVHFALGSQAHLLWDAEYVDRVQEEAQSWESFKPPTKVADDLDVVKLVEGVIKKTEKDGIKVVDADLVPYLKALLAQYVSRKALANAAATSMAHEVRAAEASSLVELT